MTKVELIEIAKKTERGILWCPTKPATFGKLKMIGFDGSDFVIMETNASAENLDILCKRVDEEGFVEWTPDLHIMVVNQVTYDDLMIDACATIDNTTACQ